MRFTTRHSDWTGFLTKEEYLLYVREVEGRERCRNWLKIHEGNLFRLERTARERIAAVKDAAE